MTAANLTLSNPIKRVAQATTSAHQSVRLNIFQRLLRQWDQLHPYNAAQVMKIRGQADLAESRAAWDEAMESLNLGAVCISNGRYHYQCRNGQAIHHGVFLCPAGADLNDWISLEMNRPFDPLGGVPFRPFIIQQPGFFWMGITYQHWVADSVSIRILMREWFLRQFDRPAATRRPVRIRDGGYWSIFGSYREGWRLGEATLSLLRWQCQFRHARRIENRNQFQDMSQRFVLLDTQTGLIDRLRVAARSAGATVNDLFLAAIAQACDRHGPTRRKSRRSNLALGTIVDLRADANRPLADVFDLLLGFGCVSCQAKHLGDWKRLLNSVARQTRQQKSGGLALASNLRMAAGVIAGKYLSRNDLLEFYRKRFALAAGNSNVNLGRCWPAKYYGDPILDYIRVAPTGPVTPLVFATTTLGDRLSVGVTYRTALVTHHRAARLGSAFLDRLAAVASTCSGHSRPSPRQPAMP
jgi:hypothetical protein